MGWRGMLRPGMRAYFIPLAAGIVLVCSAFLPWVVLRSAGDAGAAEVSVTGFPDVAALWVVGLGAAAVLLATLSLITRRNSRHPLLLVGLIALGIMFLSWRITPETIGARARIRSQAVAIVENSPAGPAPLARAASGIYLGLAASLAIVVFGLTIVVKRVSQTYVVADPNDDV
jgi:hypothetical protein